MSVMPPSASITPRWRSVEEAGARRSAAAAIAGSFAAAIARSAVKFWTRVSSGFEGSFMAATSAPVTGSRALTIAASLTHRPANGSVALTRSFEPRSKRSAWVSSAVTAGCRSGFRVLPRRMSAACLSGFAAAGLAASLTIAWAATSAFCFAPIVPASSSERPRSPRSIAAASASTGDAASAPIAAERL